MASTKISQLPTAPAIAPNDVLVANVSNVTSKLSWSTLLTSAGQFADVTELLAWDPPGYPTAGAFVRTTAEGFSYEVAASGATDHHVTTAGGVKLYVLPDAAGQLHVEAFGSLASPSAAASTLANALVAHAAQGRWLVLSSDVLSDPVVATLNGPLRWRFNGGKISLADQASMQSRTVRVGNVSGDIKVENADIDARNFAARCLEVVVSDTAFIETATFTSPKMRNGLRTNTNDTMTGGIQITGDAGGVIGVVEITNPDISDFWAENGNSSRGIVLSGDVDVQRINVFGGRVANVGPRDDGDGIVTNTSNVTDLYVQGVHFVDCEKRSIKQQADGVLVCVNNTYERTKPVTFIGTGGGRPLALSHQSTRDFYSYGCVRKTSDGSFGGLGYAFRSKNAAVYNEEVEVEAGVLADRGLFNLNSRNDGERRKLKISGLRVKGEIEGVAFTRQRQPDQLNEAIDYIFEDCDFGTASRLVHIDTAGSGVPRRPVNRISFTRSRATSAVDVYELEGSAEKPNEVIIDGCENIFYAGREVVNTGPITGRNNVAVFAPDALGRDVAVYRSGSGGSGDFENVALPFTLFKMQGDVGTASTANRDASSAQVRLVVKFHTRQSSAYTSSVAEFLLTFIKVLNQPMLTEKALVSSARKVVGSSIGRHDELDIDTITFNAVSDDEVEVVFNSSTTAANNVVQFYAEIVQFGGRTENVADRMKLVRA